MKHRIRTDWNGTKALKFIDGNELLLKDEDNKLLLNGNLIDTQVEQYLFDYHNDSLIYVKNDYTYFQNKSINKNYLPDSLNGQHVIMSSGLDFQTMEMKFELISLNSFETLFEIGNFHYMSSIKSYEDFFLITLRDQIIIYEFKGENKSIIKLNEYFSSKLEVNSILGIWNNQIIISTNLGQIVAIDLNTKELYHHWENIEGLKISSDFNEIVPMPENFILDYANNKLISVFHNQLIQINLETKDIEFTNLENEMNQLNINTLGSKKINAITDDAIYLNAWFNDDQIDVQGLTTLCRNSNMLIEAIELKTFGFGTNPLIKQNDNLFWIDLENQVHEISEIKNDC